MHFWQSQHGPAPKTKSPVETLEEQLLLELKGNVPGADLHALTVEQKSFGVAIEDTLKLLRCRGVGWTAEPCILVGTAELAFATHPRRKHNALGIDRFGLDRTQLTGPPDQVVKIDGLGHVQLPSPMGSTARIRCHHILDFRESSI